MSAKLKLIGFITTRLLRIKKVAKKYAQFEPARKIIKNSDMKEVAKKYPLLPSAKKIANGSESVVDFYNFYREVEGNILHADQDALNAYLETIRVKETQIVSSDTLNQAHLIRAYENFLLHPSQEYCEDGDYLELLTSIMEWLAGENVYFGSSEGDGACIGYWEFQNEDNF